MAFMPPPSFAMDATAGSGGPSTILPEIVTGSPEAIMAHVSQMLQQASTFLQLIDQFEQAGKQLEQAWSGKASESATQKITDTLSSFKSIVDTIQQGAQLLQTSSTLVQTAQTAYQSIVSAVNPTVASLMSNPWTYSAAVALSTSTSSALRGFIEAIGGVMKALGAGQLAQTVMSVAQIIGQIEQLFGSGSDSGTGSSTSGSSPTNSTVSQTPVQDPGAPQTVASGSGQAALGTAGGTGTSATGYDTSAQQSTDAAAQQAAQQNAAATAQQTAQHQASLATQGLSHVDPGFGSTSASPTGAATPTGAGSVPTGSTVGQPHEPVMAGAGSTPELNGVGTVPTQTPTADGGATTSDASYHPPVMGNVPTPATVGGATGAGGVPSIDAPGSGWIATDPGANYGAGGSYPSGSYVDPGVYAGDGGSGTGFGADGSGTGFGTDGNPYGWDAGGTAAGGNGDVSIDLDSSGHITSLDAPAGHDYDITISTTVDGVTTSQHAVIDDGSVGS